MHRVAVLLAALATLFLIACHSHLTAMQRLDLLVSAAQQLCPKGTLVNPTPAKTLNCRRADSCLRPVAAAQHAHQDALLAVSRMEDSSGHRLVAEVATAGAIASCAAAGIRESKAAAVPVVVVGRGPGEAVGPAVGVETAAPVPAPPTASAVLATPTATPIVSPVATPAPTLAPVPTPTAPTTPISPAPTPAPTAPTSAP